MPAPKVVCSIALHRSWCTKSMPAQYPKKVFPLAWTQLFTMLQIWETLLVLAVFCLLLVSQRPSHDPFLRTLSLTTYIPTICLICTSQISIPVCDLPITGLLIFSRLKTQIKGLQALQQHAIHIWTISQHSSTLGMIITSGILSPYLEKIWIVLFLKQKKEYKKQNKQTKKYSTFNTKLLSNIGVYCFEVAWIAYKHLNASQNLKSLRPKLVQTLKLEVLNTL